MCVDGTKNSSQFELLGANLRAPVCLKRNDRGLKRAWLPQYYLTTVCSTDPDPRGKRVQGTTCMLHELGTSLSTGVCQKGTAESGTR